MEFINIYPVVFVLKHRDDGPTHNVIEVWKKNFTGQGVVVAVVDEGFNPNHPEIRDNYVCVNTSLKRAFAFNFSDQHKLLFES